MIIHYLKTAVPMFAPVELLRDFQVNYGRQHRGGYPFVVRLIRNDIPIVSEAELYEMQRSLMSLWPEFPPPHWEIETLHRETGLSVRTWSIRNEIHTTANLNPK